MPWTRVISLVGAVGLGVAGVAVKEQWTAVAVMAQVGQTWRASLNPD